MTAILNLVGRRFGRLVVQQRSENRGKHVHWTCLCDCGNSVTTASTRLVSGRVESCGCKRSEVTALRNKNSAKHGKYNSPEWRTWISMIDRCTRPKHIKYFLYGGRGIQVCDEWKNSFAEFYEHIGPRPSSGHSIDRIDPNRGYEPGNVRWASIEEQNNNKRSNVTVSLEGVRMTAAQVARKFHISYRAAVYRIRHGKLLT